MQLRLQVSPLSPTRQALMHPMSIAALAVAPVHGCWSCACACNAAVIVRAKSSVRTTLLYEVIRGLRSIGRLILAAAVVYHSNTEIR